VVGNRDREERRDKEEEGSKRSLDRGSRWWKTLIGGLGRGQDPWRVRKSEQVTYETSEEYKTPVSSGEIRSRVWRSSIEGFRTAKDMMDETYDGGNSRRKLLRCWHARHCHRADGIFC
jgi:hypothetical protein